MVLLMGMTPVSNNASMTEHENRERKQMAYEKQIFKTGVFRVHEPVEGWPTVFIKTYRHTPYGLVEDTLQIKTPYVPTVGSSVQGHDHEYHEVLSVEYSYQMESAPSIVITCRRPRSTSLNC